MSIVPIDITSELAVSDYLTQCRDWLATCVEMTGPEQIASAKAEIATAAEATKQLGLSKEIQLDAQEMVRRAEYAIDKAVRKAQATGDVATKEDNLLASRARGGTGVSPSSSKPRPVDFFGGSADARSEAKAMGDLDAADFDGALAEAKAEGNLSRANVARKAREKSGRAAPEIASEPDDPSLALLNDIRGPWTRGITKSARLMTPKARAHLIDALENALTQIRNIR